MFLDSASRCGRRPVPGLDAGRAPGSKSDTLPSVVADRNTLHGRITNKGAQRTGKVAGARPDDARWRSCRRLEQFSVNEHYREEGFSVVSIERSRPSDEYVVTVPVGCLEYSEPAQGELGRRTETRLGLGGRRPASRPIPVRADECRCSTRRRGRNEGPRTVEAVTRTSNPNTRFDGSTQTRLHAVAAPFGGLTVVGGAPAERTPRCAFRQLPG